MTLNYNQNNCRIEYFNNSEEGVSPGDNRRYRQRLRDYSQCDVITAGGAEAMAANQIAQVLSFFFSFKFKF